jgi:hypothetical protein
MNAGDGEREQENRESERLEKKNRGRTGQEPEKKTHRRCERRNRGKTDRVKHRTVETQRREE